MSVDLHLHSHFSDGNWSPSQVVARAIELGFHSIALTDHDTTAGLDEARRRAGGDIEFVNGIEFNTIWMDGEGVPQDVHILGYFIDPEAPSIKEAIVAQQAARNLQFEKTIQVFSEAGIDIRLQVEAAAGKGTLGRPHLAQAILAAGHAATIDDAYEMLMSRTSHYHVARRSITPEAAIAAIKTAGGVSSMAHPGKSDWLNDLVAGLRKSGLNALEAYHRSHSGTQVRKIMKLAGAHGLLVSGGSDCHGPWREYPASIGEVLVPDQVLNELRDASRVHA